MGQVPPVRAKLCWGLLVGVGSPAVKLGVFLHFGDAPSAKEWVRTEGKCGSSPNSLSTSNWTCFLGLSSLCGETSHHHALSLDSCDLGCNSRFFMEQCSCSSAGQDHKGLGRGTSAGWGMKGRGFDATSTHSSPRMGSTPS